MLENLLLKADIEKYLSPVLGLDRIVSGLQYQDHCRNGASFTIAYCTKSIPPYHFCNEDFHTLYVKSYVCSERPLDNILMVHDISLNWHIRNVTFGDTESCENLPAPLRWEGSIHIDGHPFFGTLLYHMAPLSMSAWYLSSAPDLHVDGRTFGPNIEEVFGILRSLKVLNKQE
jgi:hypothetical protein